MNVLTTTVSASAALLLLYITVPFLARRIRRAWLLAMAHRRAEQRARTAARLRHPSHARAPRPALHIPRQLRRHA